MRNLILFYFLCLSTAVFSQNFQWVVGIGGMESDAANAVATDAAGNVYIAGVFSDTVDFDPGPGTVTLIASSEGIGFIQKLNPDGNLLWVKQITSTNASQCEFITLDDAGNIYVVGTFKGTADLDPGAGTTSVSSTGTSANLYVLKLNNSGDFVWGKIATGLGIIVPRSLAIDAAGNVFATGNFEEEADFDPGSGTAVITASGLRDGFVLKYDASGAFQWVKQLESTSVIEGKSMALDVSGNLYLTGKFWDVADFDPGAGTHNLTSAGADDTFLLKLDAAGNFSWVKQFGGTGYEYGWALDISPAGNIYICGNFQETVDFDPGAGVFELTSAGMDDVFVLKLDLSGNLIWVKGVGGVNPDGSYYLTVDDLEQVYVTGSYSSTVDFDPGPGVTELPLTGANSAFVLKLDAAGDFQWAKAVAGMAIDLGLGLAVHWSGSLYIVGLFAETADFDPGPGVANLSAMSFDGYVLKLDVGTVSSTLNPGEVSKLIVYPNPTENVVTVTGQDLLDSAMTIYDISGRDVTHLVPMLQGGNQEMKLDLSRLLSGVYTVKTKNQTSKIYKQ